MDQKIKNILVRTAKATGRILLENFRKESGSKIVKDKTAHDYRIRADVLAEANILRMLKKSGMKCNILTEESGNLFFGESEYRLFIDPLDGTLNYSQGIPHFCTSLGLQKAGNSIFGIVHDPYTNETFLGEKGKGAFLNGKRIHVGKKKKLEDCFGAFLQRDNFANVRPVFKKFKILRQVRGLGSAALDLCYTACGRFDTIVILGANPWDIAAGMLVIEEAGGRVTNLCGNLANPFMSNVVAANKDIHKKLLDLIGE